MVYGSSLTSYSTSQVKLNSIFTPFNCNKSPKSWHWMPNVSNLQRFAKRWDNRLQYGTHLAKLKCVLDTHYSFDPSSVLRSKNLFFFATFPNFYIILLFSYFENCWRCLANLYWGICLISKHLPQMTSATAEFKSNMSIAIPYWGISMSYWNIYLKCYPLQGNFSQKSDWIAALTGEFQSNYNNYPYRQLLLGNFSVILTHLPRIPSATSEFQPNIRLGRRPYWGISVKL